MLDDRRKTHRHALCGMAKISSSQGALPRDCVVTDVSDGGVRLVADGVEVPEEFTLLFARTRESRDCRVVWRLGPEVGAEFIDTSQRDFARQLLSSEIARGYAEQQRRSTVGELEPAEADAPKVFGQRKPDRTNSP